MEKKEIAPAFAEAYAALKEREKEDFSRIANKLIHETFIIKGKDNERNDYYFAQDNLTLLKTYFAVMDFEVINDVTKGIVYLRTLEDHNRVRLNKFETVLLLILRKFYYMKSKEITSTAKIIVSVEDVVSEVRTSQIFNGDKKMATYRAAFMNLRQYKVIDYAVRNLQADSNIEILPSILLVITQEDIDSINARLKDLALDKGEEAYEEDYED